MAWSPSAKPAQRFLTRPGLFLWHLVARRPWRFAALFAFVVGAGSCAVGVQYGMKMLIDALSGAGNTVDRVVVALSVFLTLMAAESALWRLSGWLGCLTVVGTGVDVRMLLFEHLCGHSMTYFAAHRAGALGQRITATANAIGAFIGALIWNIAPPCIDFIGAVIVFSTVNTSMALALIGLVCVLAGGIGLLLRRGRPLQRAHAEQVNEAGGELVDIVSNIWAVKAFSAAKRERARLASVFGTEASAHRRSWLFLERTRVLHDICLWLMGGSMLAWAVYLWYRGEITAGSVLVISAMTFRILHGSRELALSLMGMTQHFGVVDETLRVLGQRHQIADSGHARALIPLGGAIEFEDVCFAYGDGSRVLEHFDLRVEAGEKVGIVGPSGAGKSTIVQLIQRLHEVQSGRILVDGQLINDLSQESLREAIAVVPQDIAVFHRSVLENIRYGRPDASDEEVLGAARAALCDDFIGELSEGYQTIVGERGVRLSGGQRQRIGIARALLKSAPIMLLDEATSALDTETEIMIRNALLRFAHNRTVVAVAHRLSTLMAFDRIVVLSEGRIVEDGVPAELRRRRGVFERMWRMQVEGY
ncbi:MAG: ABC transporter ATP-binding protein [Alphaproteobacteria bacterium]|nr:ABC transporter ATP-binding protein [Alphaproteobacteria bacterium]